MRIIIRRSSLREKICFCIDNEKDRQTENNSMKKGRKEEDAFHSIDMATMSFVLSHTSKKLLACFFIIIMNHDDDENKQSAQRERDNNFKSLSKRDSLSLSCERGENLE